MVGSYDGLIRYTHSSWVRIKELNRIDKHDWIRWQGPPTPAMERALKSGMSFRATDMFPNRVISLEPEK